jgi:hypothetical protein
VTDDYIPIFENTKPIKSICDGCICEYEENAFCNCDNCVRNLVD